MPSTLAFPDDAPLAALWDGSKWTLDEAAKPAGSPSSTLTSVACTSASSCMAVGSYEHGGGSLAFADLWNGAHWTVKAVPNPAGARSSALSGVACLSTASCVAVGSYGSGRSELTLAESWDGSSWKAVKTPDKSKIYNDLAAVACNGGRCLAVGSYTSGSSTLPLSLATRGSVWSMATPTSPAGGSASLDGVACYSATGCLAVGRFQGSAATQVLIDSWDGTRWSSMTPATADGWLNSVTCLTAKSCVAVGVGSLQLLAMSWNGTNWATSPVVTPPAPLKTNFSLNGVACAAAATCVTAGVTATVATNSAVTLAETLSGDTWLVTPTPDLPGPTQVSWDSVSCTSATACVASGLYWYNQGLGGVVYYPTYFGLAEQWNGRRWRITSTASFGSQAYGEAYGYHTTCVSAASCVLDGSPVPLLWKGTAWTGMPVSPGALVPTGQLACPSSKDCHAVGSFLAGDVQPAPFIASWNGSKWVSQAAPVPPNLVSSGLNGVACASGASCFAVGSYFSNANFRTYPLVDHFTGTHWSLGSMPAPKTSIDSEMDGVSCAAKMCMAVGAWDSGGEPLAERWNGARWTIEATPLPKGDGTGALVSVSCTSASFCIAVGTAQNNTTFETVPLTETWNGSKWSVDSVAYPKPNLPSAAVSCTTATACTSVGYQIERYMS
ncbi:MAG: hypothetical protein ACLQNG_05500 [Acidimicrobiales bacterium]